MTSYADLNSLWLIKGVSQTLFQEWAREAGCGRAALETGEGRATEQGNGACEVDSWDISGKSSSLVVS